MPVCVECGDSFGADDSDYALECQDCGTELDNIFWDEDEDEDNF